MHWKPLNALYTPKKCSQMLLLLLKTSQNKPNCEPKCADGGFGGVGHALEALY